MKPKLLVLTTTFPRWQNDVIPLFVYELSRRLTDSFEVHVLAPHYPQAKCTEEMDNVRVHRFRYFFQKYEILAGATGVLPTLRKKKWMYLLVPLFLAAQLVAGLRLAVRLRPDVVHAHWLIPQGVVAAVVRKFFGIPFVVTAHGADVFGLRGSFPAACKRLAISNACRVTAVSASLKRTLVEIDPHLGQPVILPMGVDTSLFTSSCETAGIRKKYGMEGPFLLYVGRLTEKKGVNFLITAMEEVARQSPSAKLLIVGGGEAEQDLRDQVNALSLSSHIMFAGWLENSALPEYYAQADVFIGPSIETANGDTEGFGLTFVEAALSGCVTIGTDAGGIGDIIVDGKTGFLVPQKNVHALSEKIVWVIENYEELAPIRENARKRCIELCDWQHIAQSYAALFFECLEERV